MRIDLNRANEHARQMQLQSDSLHDARSLLHSIQGDLRSNWRGPEMENISASINNMLTRLATLANEAASIAADIPPAAQEIRRQEDLADARIVLAREDSNVANLRRNLENAQRQHSINPTPATQSELNRAQGNLNNAIHTRNNAAAQVQSLMR